MPVLSGGVGGGSLSLRRAIDETIELPHSAHAVLPDTPCFDTLPRRLAPGISFVSRILCRDAGTGLPDIDGSLPDDLPV